MIRRFVVALALGGFGFSGCSASVEAPAAGTSRSDSSPDPEAIQLVESLGGFPGLTDEPPFPQVAVHSLPAMRTRDGRAPALADVAGDYHWSVQYSGSSLTLLPSGDWVFLHSTCSSFSRSWGAARFVDGRLVLETRDREGRLTGRAAPCVPVIWGDRMCLVGDNDKNDLANAANWGPMDIYYIGHYVLTTPGAVPELAGRPPSGPPLVPKEWEAWILQTPIRGTVTAVPPEGRARAGLGARDGVYEGMILQVGEPRSENFVQVRGVGERECEISSLGAHHLIPGELLWCDARGAGAPK